MTQDFEPDYRHIEAVARNERPGRLCVYEHLINDGFIAEVLNEPLTGLCGGNQADLRRYFELYCGFYRQMTYDTVSYEVCICEILPEGGALAGERPGPIQTRADLEGYPWDDLPRIFWDTAAARFEMLGSCLPEGMKCVGGVGNGVFEVSEDLVGFERLCYMQADDPELFAELYTKIGDLMMKLWTAFLDRYGRHYTVCRIGDDMGFKTQTLLRPQTLIDHVVPQYARLIELVHGAGYPFLLHSCGNIFDIMGELIAAGIDAKHSNEDVIAPFDEWIDRYGERIGFFGGIDTDLLCRKRPDEIYDLVLDRGARFRKNAKGFALGSGNSIPEYVPVEAYLAMIRAAQELRRREQAG